MRYINSLEDIFLICEDEFEGIVGVTVFLIERPSHLKRDQTIMLVRCV